MADRFSDPGLGLLAFSDRIWVVCPGCGGQGIWLRDLGRASCGHCGRTQTDPPRASARCVDCGRRLPPGASPRDVPRSATVMPAVCACGRKQSVPAPRPHHGRGQQPLPGWDLFLQTEVRGHRLWAHNPDHLRLIRDFVASPHRERPRHDAGSARNRSVCSRLPRWMKEARAREDVLAGIARLEAKLSA